MFYFDGRSSCVKQNWVPILGVLLVFLACSKAPEPEPQISHFEKTFPMQGNQEGNCITNGFQSFYITGTSTSGSNSSALILKLNRSGEIVWQKEIGTTHKGSSLICTGDDNLLLIGTSSESGNQDVFLAKLSPNGDIIWESRFGGVFADQGKDVIELEDGSYMLIGTTQSFGTGAASMFVVRTDSDGNEIWSRTFGGDALDGGSELVQINPNEVMLLGFTESFGAGGRDIYLQTVSTDGDSLWSATYGGSGYEESQAICKTFTGYAMCNHSASEEPNHSLFATKIDASGFVEWEHHFGTTTDHEGGEAILEDYDGSFVFVGRTNSFGNDEQVYFIKTDANGNILEELNFGSDGDQRGNDIAQGANDYLIAGTSTVNGDSDIIMIVHPK